MSSDSAREGAVAEEPDAGGEDTVETPDAEAAEAAEDRDDGELAHADRDDKEDGEEDDAEVGDEELGDEADSAGAEGTGSDRVPKRALLGSAALALAAFIVAAVFGVLWLVTGTGEQAELASARNAVADSARDAVQAVTEVDYQNPDRFFERSRAVSTEAFGKQLTQAEDSLRKALAQAKTKVETSVTDVAVQELNARKGTATVLAVANTDITQGDRNATKVLRLQGQMERVSTGGGKEWKLAGLSEVPVVGSGAQAPNAGQQSGSGAQQGGSANGSSQGSQQGSGQGSGSN